jgi:uncharacterized protein YbjT (DUF2867 family)
MKVLAAGASGAIGKPLIAGLIRRGHTVAGIARSTTGLESIASRLVHKCRYISIGAGAGAHLLGVRVGGSCGIADLKVCASPIARYL